MNDAQRIAAALDLVTEWVYVDGDHHKRWLIDQIVRALTEDDYEAWVAAYEAPDDELEIYPEWDTGVAP